MQIERRLFPRYPTNLPVVLSIPHDLQGAEFPGEALNLSQNGIQVSGNAELVDHLLRQTGSSPECLIRFQAPHSDEPIQARCRLVVNRRMAQDSYYLGFKLLEFVDNSETTLLEYLSVLGLKYQ